MIESETGEYLIAGSNGGSIVVWNLKDFEIVHSVQNAHRDKIVALDTSGTYEINYSFFVRIDFC